MEKNGGRTDKVTNEGLKRRKVLVKSSVILKGNEFFLFKIAKDALL